MLRKKGLILFLVLILAFANVSPSIASMGSSDNLNIKRGIYHASAKQSIFPRI